ncbi:MAG: endolytic transglycosylase MltG [Erysipelotrichales bacterium]|nr:endolytic transglycosylase MltG [Erysipelotrichales bacterium]MBQ1385556.1 endolytic transglycosylase MltG [Erysipelotrichales bacterium]MBQ2310791.1 endolytic transglycosylase MltG [Erysipelotrichales bacterium]MBQ2479111.1 endolytic transglycosylase MltG [Erysipelotrichales bacterium]MBQ4375049.1 endolytic transglycosylase MltG [Erysipelotrichales bacterium]
MIKKLLIALLVLLVLAGGAAAGGYFYYKNGLKPVSEVSEEVEFRINDGEYGDVIYEKLSDAGLIKDKFIAKVYVKLNHKGDFKKGRFALDKSWDLPTIIETINDETKAKPEEITVRFTDGDWAKDFAKTIEENFGYPAEEVLEFWNDIDYCESLMNDYWFLTDHIFESEHVFLEGYLAPETYRFIVDSSLDDITRRLLDQTAENLAPFKDQMLDSWYNVHELMTLASIVQYEGNTQENMDLIAGVFYNRLDDGWMLQSSATTCYALYTYDDWRSCELNHDIGSAYNTYTHWGLTPGPICNPGIKAIRATMEPTRTNYYYFMADACGDGTVYFAETYAEHERNVEKYLTCY